jgi:hypothetical protein
MRLLFHTFRTTVATGISLWMAVLACLAGCTLPILAKSGAINAPSIRENAIEQCQPDMMAEMENCPHHSGGNTPTKPNDPRPVRGGMSCCPVEVTVASKPDPATPQVVPASDFVLASDFSLATIPFFHSVEFVPPVWHSGRDTLLKTHLLRI